MNCGPNEGNKDGIVIFSFGRGELGPSCIILHYNKGQMILMFSKSVGVNNSNEAEVLSTLEASRIYLLSFQDSLILESVWANATSWIACEIVGLWRFSVLSK